MGLPSGTKWACCNVGADKPEAFGGYYAWGETEEKDWYDWSTYIYCNGSQNTCYHLDSSICGTKFDVVSRKWGDNWQLPSSEQIQELCYYCSYEDIDFNDSYGLKFTGPNGSSVILPAAGLYDSYFSPDITNKYGYYWSGSQSPDDAESQARFLSITRDSASLEFNWRMLGFSVRPVSK